MNQPLSIVAAVALAGAPLLLIELMARRVKLDGELTRKLVHTLSTVATCLVTLLVSLHVLAIIAAGFFVFMLALRSGRHWRSLYRVERRSWGELTLPLGVAVAGATAPSVGVFVTAMLILGFADTAAALIGRRFGCQKLPGLPAKSVAGSAACAATAGAIGLAAARLGVSSWQHAIVVALVATLAEALSPRGLDNLTIPVAILGVALIWG